MQKSILTKIGEVEVSTDKDKLDIGVIHKFLSTEAYWSKGIPFDIVKQAVENSFNFGMYKGGAQIGYARIITDFTTHAYLCDVFILPEYQGNGLGKILMDEVMNEPCLANLRRWMLATSTAAGLYKKFGFTPLNKPEIFFEKHDPGVYTRDLNL